MSWQTEAGKVGLAGLTPEEAAIGALQCDLFQNIPDPLENPLGNIIVVSID